MARAPSSPAAHSFGTLIGLLHRGEPVLGLIDQPVTRERWVGVQGQPTHFTSPMGGTAACRPCPTLATAELSCTSPEIFDAAGAARFERVRQAARRVTWGGIAMAMG